MRPIYITENALGDDTAIVEDFYHFYSSIPDGGIFGTMIGTGPVPDVYAALNYSGEVRNGGHRQFIANSDNRAVIVQAALSGLNEVKALAQREILSEMRDWVRDNSQSVEVVFGNDLPGLDRLDERFFAEQDRQSVEAQAAVWIKAYPDLRVVSGAEFMALLHGEAAAASPLISRPGGFKVGLLERVMTTIFGR
jgi:hypothetical protein